VVTDPPHTNTHTPTNRQDRLQYTAPQLASVQCNEKAYVDYINNMRSEITLSYVVHQNGKVNKSEKMMSM